MKADKDAFKNNENYIYKLKNEASENLESLN